MRTNQKGFSLIELMIVVAIIGILSAIAVPNYMAFQRKARQSEARSTLGAIAQAQTIYSQDAGGYSDNLIAIGYIPDGTLAYDCGFGASIPLYGPQDTAAGTYAYTFQNTVGSGFCAQPLAAPNCASLAVGAAGVVGVGAAVGAIAATAAAAATFDMACNGWIGGSIVDEWHITQLKVITNNQSGI